MSKLGKVSPFITLVIASLALMVSLAGCKSNNNQETST